MSTKKELLVALDDAITILDALAAKHEDLLEELKDCEDANRALRRDQDSQRCTIDSLMKQIALMQTPTFFVEERAHKPRPLYQRLSWCRRMWLWLAAPLLVLLFPLPAHADLASSWGVMVRTGADVVAYSDNQNDEVPIALPTNRYVCTRRPIMTMPQMLVVMVSCTEGGRQAFVIGTGCSRSETDSNQSVLTVNVSKNATPLTVTFTVACRTLDDTKTFL